jgi:hypothetical protein
MVEHTGFFLGQYDDPASPVGKPLKQRLSLQKCISELNYHTYSRSFQRRFAMRYLMFLRPALEL